MEKTVQYFEPNHNNLDILLAMFAQFPIRDDIGGDLFVAFDAFLGESDRVKKNNYEKGEENLGPKQFHRTLLLWSFALLSGMT